MDSSSTGARSAQPASSGVTREFAELPTSEWKSHFLQYYADERGYATDVLEAAQAVLESLALDVDRQRAWMDQARMSFDRTGTDGKGTLGEAHLSYVLEHKRQIILTDAGWKTTPFQVSKGIDLVGVRLPDFTVCHVEVKTWKATTDGEARAAFKAMTEDQLLLTRLKPLFTLTPNAGHHQAVLAEFLRRLEAQPLPHCINLEEVNLDRLQGALGDRLLRIGGVVADFRGRAFPPDIPGPVDACAEWPCELLMLSVQGLDDALARLTGLEESLRNLSIEARRSQLTARLQTLRSDG